MKLDPLKDSNEMKEFNINVKKKIRKGRSGHSERKKKNSGGIFLTLIPIIFIFGKVQIDHPLLNCLMGWVMGGP